MSLSPQSAFDFLLLALCIWREARGESLAAKQAVAWTVKNRVLNPRWWGNSYNTVILMPWQFSSFNHNDPNAVKWPSVSDPAWADSLSAAGAAYDDTLPDPTDGATSYFDMSMDADPPKWATDGSNVRTVDIGRLHFYKLA